MISKSATLGNQLEKLSPHAAEAATSSEAPHATLSGPSAAPLGVPSQTIPDRPRRRWWPWLLVLALAGAGLGISFGRPWLERIPRFWERSAAHPAKPPQRTVPIVAAPVRQADLDLYLNGLGTVTGFQTVTIRSRVDGELVRVAFTEGQMVQEGDLLAEIDPRAYQARLQQAEGQLAQDEAALKGAELTLQRYRQLVASNTVTGQQVDEQVALVRQAEGAVLADRGTIADAKLQVTYCRIEAPLSGRIGLRLVDAGNIVRANDPNGLAVITQIQPITMTFTIAISKRSWRPESSWRLTTRST
jgi:multidrug efflux system membrane fusion protein